MNRTDTGRRDPETEAGRVFAAAWEHVTVPWIKERVADIEAEAKAALRAELVAGVEGLHPIALRYPDGPVHIEHDESCAYAYGNTTYPCHCFVRQSVVVDLIKGNQG